VKPPSIKHLCAVFRGLASVPFIAFAAGNANADEGRHALIVGIGNYSAASQASQLLGVAKDMQNARSMAQSMGVDPSNIVELRDQQATKARILAELERIRAKVKPGDRVFVYYSGHGTRFASEQGCVEGLQTYTDGRLTVADVLTEEDLAKYTRPISERADKVIAFIDACFSGGVLQQTTRSLIGGNGGLRPRFNQTANAQCNTPVNTRNLLSNLERMGVHSENFVQIAAANRDELSWENATLGGLVTHSMSQCLMGEARDLNRSGAISLDEVRVCAQTKLNALMKPHESRGLLPSTIQVRGNRNLIAIPTQTLPTIQTVAIASPSPQKLPDPVAQPAAVVKPPVAAPLPVTPAPVTQVSALPKVQSQTTASEPPKPSAPSVTNAPITVSQPTTVSQTPAASEIVDATDASNSGAQATLTDIYAQRNPRIKLNVTTPKSVVISRDLLSFTVRPGTSGYLYALLLGTDEKSFYLLYPNKIDSKNWVDADRTYDLPGPGWQIKAAGPVGTNRLLFVLSKSPLDPALFVSDPNSGGGIFTYTVSDEASRARLINFFLGRSDKKGNREFGAVLASIEERQ